MILLALSKYFLTLQKAEINPNHKLLIPNYVFLFTAKVLKNNENKQWFQSFLYICKLNDFLCRK